MNTIKRHVGLMASAVLAVTSIWACTATRNSDGSMTFTFAPDIVITAKGLEDALRKLVDLMVSCSSGTLHRPCTQGEFDDIENTIERVLSRKEKVLDGSLPPSF